MKKQVQKFEAYAYLETPTWDKVTIVNDLKNHRVPSSLNWAVNQKRNIKELIGKRWEQLACVNGQDKWHTFIG